MVQYSLTELTPTIQFLNTQFSPAFCEETKTSSAKIQSWVIRDLSARPRRQQSCQCLSHKYQGVACSRILGTNPSMAQDSGSPRKPSLFGRNRIYNGIVTRIVRVLGTPQSIAAVFPRSKLGLKGLGRIQLGTCRSWRPWHRRLLLHSRSLSPEFLLALQLLDTVANKHKERELSTDNVVEEASSFISFTLLHDVVWQRLPSALEIFGRLNRAMTWWTSLSHFRISKINKHRIKLKPLSTDGRACFLFDHCSGHGESS